MLTELRLSMTVIERYEQNQTTVLSNNAASTDWSSRLIALYIQL